MLEEKVAGWEAFLSVPSGAERVHTERETWETSPGGRGGRRSVQTAGVEKSNGKWDGRVRESRAAVQGPSHALSHGLAVRGGWACDGWVPGGKL